MNKKQENYENIIILWNAIESAQKEINNIIERELTEVADMPFEYVGSWSNDGDEDERSFFESPDGSIVVSFSKEYPAVFMEAIFYWSGDLETEYSDNCREAVRKIEEYYEE